MRLNKINDTITVGPQIDVADIASLHQAGFRSFLVTRPEGEDPGQPSIEQFVAAASEFDLPLHQVPVISGQMTQDNIDAFCDYFDNLPKPVFVWCRSGTRAATLWAFAQARKGMPVNSILTEAAGAGYDLSGLAPHLQALIKA